MATSIGVVSILFPLLFFSSDAKLKLPPSIVSPIDELTGTNLILKNCVEEVLYTSVARRSVIFLKQELEGSNIATAILKDLFLPKVVTYRPKLIKRRRFYVLFTKHNNHKLLDFENDSWLMRHQIQNRVSRDCDDFI